MNNENVINVLVTVTLIELMITIGLDVSIAELRQVLSNWSMLVRAMVANYMLVPVVTILLLLLFQPHPIVAAGFLILAVCPGAPYGPPFTASDLFTIEIIVLLLSSSNCFHSGSVTMHEVDSFVLAEIGQPVPGEHSLDTHNQIVLELANGRILSPHDSVASFLEPNL